MATSNAQIYTAINNARLELKADIKAVDDKVEAMRVEIATAKTKLGFLMGGISVLISGISTIIMDRMLR